MLDAPGGHMVTPHKVCTSTPSWTGPYLYSDLTIQLKTTSTPFLNRFACIPLIGSLAGVVRVVLGILHVLGHCLAALIYQDTGHLWHAAKGVCEIGRGVIEALPIIGQVVSIYLYYYKIDLVLIEIEQTLPPPPSERETRPWAITDEELRNTYRSHSSQHFLNEDCDMIF